MTFLRLLLVVTLLASARLPGTELPAPWPARLAALSAPRAVVAEFTESRHTPLKKQPVVVSGTVRIDHARGLSLAYDQPRAPFVILDEKGLLLRHPDGREQAAPPEAETDLRLLHALFTFDLPTLEKSYSATPSESADGAWKLVFTRLPDSPASYRELTLAGTADRLTTITLAKTPNLRTAITLSAQTVDSAFSPEDRARYFR
ncbi:MAG: hypothetical protein H7067_15625 [Burkholderiales bacterium]|nr:hypothetical protein [Opitutaceae bacterium]